VFRSSVSPAEGDLSQFRKVGETMGNGPHSGQLVVAAVAAAALALSAPAPAQAAAKLNASTAATALEKRVAVKYKRQARGRQVIASCRRRSKVEYFCLYGIHANAEDAVVDPDTRYVYSGTGYVRLRHGKLVADPLAPRRGDDYAP
jgi:tRNA A37 threonylcarbamoyladenosine modification protein TsaB